VLRTFFTVIKGARYAAAGGSTGQRGGHAASPGRTRRAPVRRNLQGDGSGQSHAWPRWARAPSAGSQRLVRKPDHPARVNRAAAEETSAVQ